MTCGKLYCYRVTKMKTAPQDWLMAYLQNLMLGSSFTILRESILWAIATVHSFQHVTCLTFNSFCTMPSFYIA